MVGPPQTIGGGGIYYSYAIRSGDVKLKQAPITDSPVVGKKFNRWRFRGDHVSSTSSIPSHERVEFILSDTQNTTTPSTVRVTIVWIRRNWFIVTFSSLMFILICVIIVAGLCGDGNCNGKGSNRSRNARTSQIGSPVDTNAPTTMPQTNIVMSPLYEPSPQLVATLEPTNAAVEMPPDNIFVRDSPSWRPSSNPSSEPGAVPSTMHLHGDPSATHNPTAIFLSAEPSPQIVSIVVPSKVPGPHTPTSPPSLQLLPRPISDSQTISPSKEPSTLMPSQLVATDSPTIWSSSPPPPPPPPTTVVSSLPPGMKSETSNPSSPPSHLPTISPTKTPTNPPFSMTSTAPTPHPTMTPSVRPSNFSTLEPSLAPAFVPSVVASRIPTLVPANSNTPATEYRTEPPIAEPTATAQPTRTLFPTLTSQPSTGPTNQWKLD